MRRGSIAFRIFLYSALWLVVALAVTAFLLTGLYARALDNTLSDTLEFHLETLVGVVLSGEGDKIPAANLADARFSRPASGWYWEVHDDKGHILNFSPSLVGSILPEARGQFDENNLRSSVTKDGYGTSLRMIERRITAGDKAYAIVVTGNLDENAALTDSFRGQTAIVLGAVGLMLAAMSTIVARFALRPIERLRDEIERVREGETEHVKGDFPREVAPLADEVNQLLRSNAQIIERARNQVGNLAHGLKTPLAVLRNEANSSRSALAKIAASEAEKMNSIVAAYLDRSKLSARSALVGRRTDTADVLARLVRVMTKLYPARKISFKMLGADIPWFRGDIADLEEMAGNLIDNACKWAGERIDVRLSSDSGTGDPVVLIRIDDDGPGLTAEETSLVSRRGVRLDEKVAGSGLGLDIVRELVDVYGGSLKLGPATMGGLRVELRLPQVRRERR